MRGGGPPSGWYDFGTHARWDAEDMPDLEFSDEVDESGMPLWERPKPRVSREMAMQWTVMAGTIVRYSGTEADRAIANFDAPSPSGTRVRMICSIERVET